jgi:hypothetical protein
MTARTQYLVVWWMAQVPHVAIFTNKVAAYAAANVRNALMVVVRGSKIIEVLDWYRRNDAGEPMPAEWRDIAGQPRMGEYT